MIATIIATRTGRFNAYYGGYPWSPARQGLPRKHKIFGPYGNLHVCYASRRKRSSHKSFHTWPLRGLRVANKQETPKRHGGGTREQARRGSQHPNGKHRLSPLRELHSSCPEQKLGGPRPWGRRIPRNGRQKVQRTRVPSTKGGEEEDKDQQNPLLHY